MPAEGTCGSRADAAVASPETDGFAVTKDAREPSRRCASGGIGCGDAVRGIVAGHRR